MNKKRLLLVISILCLLFVLTGCARQGAAAVQEVKLISLDMTFAEARSEGLFTALLTYPLAQAINYLDPMVGIAGAITIVTVVINAVLLVFTFKSNVSMQRMQTIQPELTKIQKKYEGRTDQMSQQRQAQEMQALYAKYDIHPFGALLVTFLQLPILISVYTAVRRSYAVAHAEFFGVSLETTPMQGILSMNVVIIAIFVLMVCLQLLSMQVPKMLANAKAKAEAEKHHKSWEKPKDANFMMTYGMIIFLAFIMLNWPTALSLYYAIFSLINVVKTLAIDKMTNK